METKSLKTLIVDDEPVSLKSIRSTVEQTIHQVAATASSSTEVLEKCQALNPDIILMDINLRDTLDGIDIAREVHRLQPHIAVVFVTGNSPEPYIERLKTIKSYGFTTKPVKIEELVATMEMVYYRHLALVKDEQIFRNFNSLIHVLVRALEMRDPYTVGHQKGVERISVRIGRHLGLSEERLSGLSIGALLHDIGKIRIPAQILTKPGRLTPGEYALIKEHPEDGYELLQPLEFRQPVAEFVRQHHERFDGSGYPHGLKGSQIHLEAQIIGLADVYESMANHRPYRFSPGKESAIRQIMADRGVSFSEEVVDAFGELCNQNLVDVKRN
jgi:putative two-component system response regulator